MRTIVIGTRKSDLAVTQTNHVVKLLEQAAFKNNVDCRFEVKKIVTKGDQILDVTLNKVGGKGLFVKEIEQAMLEGTIDMAVHSMKDMPWELPEGLVIGAIPEREDAHDCIVSKDGKTLDQLPQGAIIGTSSLRRGSQLKHFRPDFDIQWIRGNINTRLKKLETESFDAIVLATAGLVRMGWQERITEKLSSDVCLPAVGQGALCVQCRDEDAFLLDVLKYINDPYTAFTVHAERNFLARLNGGCQVPIGAYAQRQEDGKEPVVVLEGMVGSPDGQQLLRDQLQGTDPQEVGRRLAEKLIERGADRILQQVRG